MRRLGAPACCWIDDVRARIARRVAGASLYAFSRASPRMRSHVVGLTTCGRAARVEGVSFYMCWRDLGVTSERCWIDDARSCRHFCSGTLPLGRGREGLGDRRLWERSPCGARRSGARASSRKVVPKDPASAPFWVRRSERLLELRPLPAGPRLTAQARPAGSRSPKRSQSRRGSPHFPLDTGRADTLAGHAVFFWFYRP